MNAIKYAVLDALDNNILQFDIFSDSRSSLEALSKFVCEHSVVEEIKRIITRNNINIKLHWVKAHAGIWENELVDAEAKAATTKSEVDIYVKLTKIQLKNKIRTESLKAWQDRWELSDVGRDTFRIFSTVSIRRLHSNFYINQIITGHGILGQHQSRLFGKSSMCICDELIQDVHHVLYDCEVFNNIRSKYAQATLRLPLEKLCTDYYGRKYIQDVVKYLIAISV